VGIKIQRAGFRAKSLDEFIVEEERLAKTSCKELSTALITGITP